MAVGAIRQNDCEMKLTVSASQPRHKNSYFLSTNCFAYHFCSA